MDYFKKATTKNFTAWDLNCPKFVKTDTELKKKFRRTARRKIKMADKELI